MDQAYKPNNKNNNRGLFKTKSELISMKSRKFSDHAFKFIVYFFGFLAVVPLFLLIFYVFKKGLAALNLELLTSLPKPPGLKGGGIINSILGTLILMILASLISIPFGLFAGVYLSEKKGLKNTKTFKVIINMLQSIPSIIIGIVIYNWIVRPMKSFSGFAGSIALSIMMLPIIINSTAEVLNLIPYSLKEASLALGVPYYKTLLKVIIPAGFPGILSGILLGVARIAGETAPLLFTAFGNRFLNVNPGKPIDAIPLLIYNYASSPYDDWKTIAWGASFVLTCIVLILNLLTRIGKRNEY